MGTIKQLAIDFYVTAKNFLTIRRINCSFPKLMPKIAMAACSLPSELLMLLICQQRLMAGRLLD